MMFNENKRMTMIMIEERRVFNGRLHTSPSTRVLFGETYVTEFHRVSRYIARK